VPVRNNLESRCEELVSQFAKALIICELAAPEQSEMQVLRHLRNAGEEWIHIKASLGEHRVNIADWCEKNMPVSRQWLDRHSELYKHWREFLDARRWPARSDIPHGASPGWSTRLG
jgi:hypothetical protein